MTRPVFKTPVPGDPQPLLAALRPRVGEGVLRRIAEADYGREADSVYSLLRQPLDSGKVPVRPGWRVHECCELVSNAASNNAKSPEDHMVRVYSVFFHFMAWGPDAFNSLGNDGRYGRFTESSLAIGPAVAAPALPFLCWLTEQSPPESTKSFLALAIILLQAIGGISLPKASPSGSSKRKSAASHESARWQSLETQAADLILLVDAETRYFGAQNSSMGWLLNLDSYEFGYPWWRMCRGLHQKAINAGASSLVEVCRRIIEQKAAASPT